MGSKYCSQWFMLWRFCQPFHRAIACLCLLIILPGCASSFGTINPTVAYTPVPTTTPTTTPQPTYTVTPTLTGTSTPEPTSTKVPVPETCALPDKANQIALEAAQSQGFDSVAAWTQKLVTDSPLLSKWFANNNPNQFSYFLTGAGEKPTSIFALNFYVFYAGEFNYSFPGNEQYPSASGSCRVFIVPYEEEGAIKSLALPVVASIATGNGNFTAQFSKFSNDGDEIGEYDLADLTIGSEYTLGFTPWNPKSEQDYLVQFYPQLSILYQYYGVIMDNLAQNVSYRNQTFGIETYPSNKNEFLQILRTMFLSREAPGHPMGMAVRNIMINLFR